MSKKKQQQKTTTRRKPYYYVMAAEAIGDAPKLTSAEADQQIKELARANPGKVFLKLLVAGSRKMTIVQRELWSQPHAQESEGVSE